jgi:iron complex outermembrane receptor protein
MLALFRSPAAQPVCVIAILVSLYFPSAVQAQAIEEIIVTAQKREQSLQNVTAAVTVVDMDRLQTGQINNIEDMMNIVPNVYIGNDFNMAKLFIRGVGANTSTTGSETGVAVHLDGAVIARAEGQLTSLFDLERVEVVRGPQGTLYGRNAVGGSINLITAKPTEELEGYARVTVGDYDLLGLEGAISGPISDRVRGRAAFKSEDRGGFGTNPMTGTEVDDLNRQMFRGHLQFLPSDDVDILLSAEVYTQDDASRALKFRREAFPGVARLAAPGFARPGVNGGYAVDPRDHASEVDPATYTDTWSVTGTLGWQFSDTMGFTSIVNYRDFEAFLTQDLDISGVTNSLATTGFNATVQRRDIESEQFSTELQLNFDTERFTGVFGLFYFQEDQAPVDTVGLAAILGQNHILDTLADPASGSFPPIGPTGLEIDGVFVDDSMPFDPAFPLEMCNSAAFLGSGISGQDPVPPKRVCLKSDLGTEVFAVFGQVTFDLTDSFALKVGGRFNSEERTSANPSVIIARNGLGPIIATTTAATSVKRTFDDFTPEVGFEWHSSDAVMFYATYSEGFKAGAGENAAGSTIIVDPEEIENIELGFKSTLLDNRLVLNVAAFTYELAGQQINKTLAGGPAGFSTIFENAAQTSADGLEIEFVGLLTDRFRLSGSISYLDSQYDDFLTSDPMNPRNVSTPGPPGFPADPTGFNPNEPPVQLAGNPTRNSPELAANLHWEVDFPAMGGGGYLSFLGDVSYKDEVFFTEFHRLIEGAESYTMLDLSLHYTSADEGLTAQLWVKNATDEFRATSTFQLATARTIGVTYLPPRTYGFTLGYSF